MTQNRDIMAHTEAKIIAETSAGMTGVEIYEQGKLVWSNNWFADGATESYYKQGLRDAYDTAENCIDWYTWDAQEGEPEDLDTSATTWVMATYSEENGWKFEEPQNDGQAHDFINHNADRIPSGVVSAWDNLYS